MVTRSRIVLAVHRVLLRTSRTPLARVWALAYLVVARLWAAYLAFGTRGASAYIRGSVGDTDWLPGISDVDVAIVLPRDPAGPGIARARASGRWERPHDAFPLMDLLLDYPFVFEEDDLGEVACASSLTYGLTGASEHRAAYFGDRAHPDRIRLLERPGLYGSTTDWRLVAGLDRRPPEHRRGPQSHRIAAWLELVYWWQWVSPVCAGPIGPRTASLCVKLVAEPARIWLWLAHGERPAGRADALERVLRRMPEEEKAFRDALDLHRTLPDSPDPPLAEALPVLVRLSARIAGLLAAEVAGAGATEVRLAGADPAELLRAHGSWQPTDALPGGRDPDLLPLCDWRSLVRPSLPDECFASLAADPGDPAVVGAAAVSQPYGPYAGLRAGDLMIFPGIRARTELRAIQCPVTDPVSFALARGSSMAAFPNVSGWSAQDTARRAVAEHRARLRGAAGAGGPALAALLTAARAALFHDSLREGDPYLPLTLTETTRLLAARSTEARGTAEAGLGGYCEYAGYRTEPSAHTIAALRKLVLGLDAFRDPACLVAVQQ